MSLTNEQEDRLVRAAEEIVNIVKEEGLVIQGNLYMKLADMMTMEQFSQLIGILKEAKRIKEVGFNLLQIGEE